MKSFVVLLLVVLGFAAASPSQGVQAAPARIPAAAYPWGAHIGFHPVLTNVEVDCMWGFLLCEGNLPNFHVRTQTELHRISGWGQFAGIQRRGRTTMAFELFVSRYAPVPQETGTAWSERAFLDLQAALHAQGYHLDRRNAALLPAARAGALSWQFNTWGSRTWSSWPPGLGSWRSRESPSTITNPP
jgi:hypothetical protein